VTCSVSQAPRNSTRHPDNIANFDVESTTTGEGDSQATGEGDSPATGEGDSPATGDGYCPTTRVVVETQEEAQGEVPEQDEEKKEDENGQTVSLQTSEVNEKEPSATE
jgi:hypothetical protein